MAASGALKHIRNYASAGMLAAIAGVISFPILTRNLSVEEYGILGLITSSLTLFIAFGKLGMQHAVIRFFAQIKNNNIAHSLGQLNSTVSLLFLLFASVTTLIWLIVGFAVLPNLLQHSDISSLFLIASGTVFLRLLSSGILNFLRAQQRSAVVGFAQILIRYLHLFLMLALLFTGKLNPYFVLVSLLLAELVGVVFAAKKYRPDFSFSWAEISAPLGKAMLLYGFPLMMLESLGLVLRLSDRYIIEAMLGVNALGMYSASYNLTSYLDIILLTALVQAIRPHFMQLWEGEGEAETKSFLSTGLNAYLVLGIPFIAIFSLVAPHLLNFLASPKYAPGTVIIPFVALSFLLDGSMHFLAAGLYIKKNTKVFMVWGAVATLLNLALNILFIPIFGILGAAAVTIISFAVFMLAVAYRSFKLVSFDINFRTPFFALLMSLFVYALLFKLDMGSDVYNLLVKGAIGTCLLGVGAVLIDTSIRNLIVGHLRGSKVEPTE